MRPDQWELMCELRDLANRYPPKIAAKKMSKHYDIPEECLLEQYFDKIATKKMSKHYDIPEECLLEQYFDCDFAEEEDDD